MAEHYGTAVIPTGVRKPREKANVERAVGILSTWIIAALRNRQFFSLWELNEAMRHKLADFNQKPFQKKPGNRESALPRNCHSSCPFPQNLSSFHRLFRMRANIARPADKPFGVPWKRSFRGILPVFLRHMLRHRTVLPWIAIKPFVGRYTGSLVEYFDHMPGKPDVHLVLDILVRNTIIHLIAGDVISDLWSA